MIAVADLGQRPRGGWGREKEWRSPTLEAYKRRTERAEVVIAGAYLAETDSRRVRRALAGRSDATDAKALRARRAAFLAKWRRRCRTMVIGLADAGRRLITFLCCAPAPWPSLPATSAVERRHREFKRRIKTPCALPSAPDRLTLRTGSQAEATLRQLSGSTAATRRRAPIEGCAKAKRAGPRTQAGHGDLPSQTPQVDISQPARRPH